VLLFAARGSAPSTHPLPLAYWSRPVVRLAALTRREQRLLLGLLALNLMWCCALGGLVYLTTISSAQPDEDFLVETPTLIEEKATLDSETVLETETTIPTPTIVPSVILTPTPIPMPSPTRREIVEPTKLPYVFPTPVYIPPMPRAQPTPTRAR